MTSRGDYYSKRGRGSWRGRGYNDNRGGRGYQRGRGSWNVQQHSRGGGPSGYHRQPPESPQRPPASKRPRMVQSTLTDCPYKHWNMYLLGEDYISDQSGIGQKVATFIKHFKRDLTNYADEEIDLAMSIAVDYNVIKTDQDIISGMPNLSEDIKNTPELILNCIALAFHTVLQVSFLTPCDTDRDDVRIQKNESLGLVDKRRFFVRLYGYESEAEVTFKRIKAPLYGKCVSVSGTVLRVSSVKPLVTQLAFKCALCQEINTIATPDGKYILPSSCTTSECHSRSFTPLRSSHLTETIDWQKIRLQEITGDDKREVGRIPRMIDCELMSDLVDSCVPGDVVTVTAVVKATDSNEDNYSRSSKDKCMFMLYLRAISVVTTKPSSNGGTTGTEFTIKDYYAIREIHSDKNILRLLVGSLCPTIYGHELVKTGLLLCLFGGRLAISDNEKCLSIRGNPHILVVGDPGLGKSQMLQATANVAPRGVYVCGNTSTTTGLTVTMTREPGSSQYSLEAGALVMADQGCCCIDEFDKMGVQHQALLEAMEQQSISIAKAGIVCTLPARASILAAANPVGGHYNKGKTVSENLKMNGALLSRFDLVFILLDKPDEEMDCMLSEHVMSLHSGKSNKVHKTVGARRNCDGSISSSINGSLLDLGDTSSLKERLKIHSKGEFDPLPTNLLRKYIAYARTYVHPTLNSDASKVLQEFYLHLRKNHSSSDSTPITTRQLESLIRLTEARAKLELREVACEQDAKDIIELMENSMRDTYSDENGLMDFQRSQHGSGMSQKSQTKRFVSELTRMSENTGNSVFTIAQLTDISQRMGLKMKCFSDFIYSLNNQGFLLKKGPSKYKIQTSYL